VFLPPYAAKGCWARLYGAKDFAGPVRQIEGPVFVESVGAWMVRVPEMHSAPPQPLFSQVRSLQVGPHATLDAYGAPLFRLPTLTVGPQGSVAEIPFDKRVASFTLRCEA
jgi:hypothetical protein